MKDQLAGIIIYISCCLLSLSGYAGNTKETDFNDISLSGNEKVDTINKIAHSISQAYPDSCLILAQTALKLSKENNYSFGEAEALFNIGNAYLFKLDVQKAVANYLQSSSLFIETSPSQSYGKLLLQIGLIYNYTGNYIKAIEYFRKSRSVFEMLEDSNSILNIYDEIGLAFAQAKEYDSAFYYLHHALRLSKTMNDPLSCADIYNNMGLVYLWMKENDPENDDIDGRQAINYLDSSMYYWTTFGNSESGANTLSNLGEAYAILLDPPDFHKAESYCKLGISKLKQTKSIISIANVYAFLGSLYLQNNNIHYSKAYLDSCLYLIRFYRDTIESWVYEYPQAKLNSMKFKYWTSYYTYVGMHEWFDQVGNYDSAMYYYTMAIASRDSINMIKTRFQVDYLLADAENQRLATLESESKLNRFRALRNLQWIIGLTSLIVVLIVLIIIIIRQNKLKTTQEKICLQQKLFRLQLNPHFIFNSLGSIQSIIIDQQNDIAIKYISRFSRLMRNLLDGSFSEFTSLSKELDLAENYLDLQKVRFKGKFSYRMIIPDELDTEEIVIPSFLLQPFIENAIEHGIMHKESHGSVIISAYPESEYIILEVVDDGIGREKSNKLKSGKNKDHQSLATDITKERLAVLNKKLKQKIHFEIIDLKDENGNAVGTKVVFGIPLSL